MARGQLHLPLNARALALDILIGDRTGVVRSRRLGHLNGASDCLALGRKAGTGRLLSSGEPRQSACRISSPRSIDDDNVVGCVLFGVVADRRPQGL